MGLLSVLLRGPIFYWRRAIRATSVACFYPSRNFVCDSPHLQSKIVDQKICNYIYFFTQRKKTIQECISFLIDLIEE